MGNKALILSLSVISLLFAQAHYPEIDRLIEKVKTKRVGLDKDEIKKLKNPFVNEKKLVKLKKKAIQQKIIKKRRWFFKLTSIFDRRARINGRWYRVGSKIGKYRLVHVDNDYVILARGKKELRLYLNKKKRKKKLIKIWSK